MSDPQSTNPIWPDDPFSDFRSAATSYQWILTDPEAYDQEIFLDDYAETIHRAYGFICQDQTYVKPTLEYALCRAPNCLPILLKVETDLRARGTPVPLLFDYIDDMGRDLLTISVCDNRVDATRILLDLGFCPEQSFDGNSLLAISLYKRIPITHALLRAGASPCHPSVYRIIKDSEYYPPNRMYDSMAVKTIQRAQIVWEERATDLYAFVGGGLLLPPEMLLKVFNATTRLSERF